MFRGQSAQPVRRVKTATLDRWGLSGLRVQSVPPVTQGLRESPVPWVQRGLLESVRTVLWEQPGLRVLWVRQAPRVQRASVRMEHKARRGQSALWVLKGQMVMMVSQERREQTVLKVHRVRQAQLAQMEQ